MPWQAEWLDNDGKWSCIALKKSQTSLVIWGVAAVLVLAEHMQRSGFAKQLMECTFHPAFQPLHQLGLLVLLV